MSKKILKKFGKAASIVKLAILPGIFTDVALAYKSDESSNFSKRDAFLILKHFSYFCIGVGAFFATRPYDYKDYHKAKSEFSNKISEKVAGYVSEQGFADAKVENFYINKENGKVGFLLTYEKEKEGYQEICLAQYSNIIDTALAEDIIDNFSRFTIDFENENSYGDLTDIDYHIEVPGVTWFLPVNEKSKLNAKMKELHVELEELSEKLDFYIPNGKIDDLGNAYSISATLQNELGYSTPTDYAETEVSGKFFLGHVNSKTIWSHAGFTPVRFEIGERNGQTAEVNVFGLSMFPDIEPVFDGFRFRVEIEEGKNVMNSFCEKNRIQSIEHILDTNNYIYRPEDLEK